MKRKIPARNKSPYGWWITVILVRYEQQRDDRNNLNRRCLAWENTIILKAKDREEAYRKALVQGKLHGSKGWDCIDHDTRRKGKWVFEGIASLLPIYEELEDGAEILWNEHKVSFRKLRAWVRTKQQLETFQDSG